MQLEKLFNMQQALDQHIEEKHELQHEDLFNRKVLALLVELGELANETRCFKFWSIKPSSEKSVVLEEFVDGIHFILSLGIECGFQNLEYAMNIEPPASKCFGAISSDLRKCKYILKTVRMNMISKSYLNPIYSWVRCSVSHTRKWKKHILRKMK